ncbi:MAG TPA: dipeptide epimerase [Pirellulaceae bacterium]|jgi:L-alanine-DL-glutamate epimerase-like enolase superfamily enzyme|nr:dipeptide epimerase [Pirellulaceae bacterium]
MRIEIRRFDLPLTRPFGISRGTSLSQRTILVSLGAGDVVGHGEATTNDYYGVSEAGLIEAITAIVPILQGWAPGPPEELFDAIEPLLAGDAPGSGVRRFALCAIDQAMHDLWGKLQEQPLYSMWGGELADLPVSNYTVALDAIPAMVENLRENAGWPRYKIKLGREDDLEILAALRAETDVPFRVDANAGWSFDRACELVEAITRFGVELIEQPLAVEDDRRVAELAKASPLPLFADESCRIVADVDRCADAGFAGVNLKLVKCGGLTPARRLIERAKARGLAVMAGCMTESSVGISALAQLLPWLDYVDLDGAYLLAEDPAEGVSVDHGIAIFPPAGTLAANGTGARLIDPSAGLIATFDG